MCDLRSEEFKSSAFMRSDSYLLLTQLQLSSLHQNKINPDWENINVTYNIGKTKSMLQLKESNVHYQCTGKL